MTSIYIPFFCASGVASTIGTSFFLPGSFSDDGLSVLSGPLPRSEAPKATRPPLISFPLISFPLISFPLISFPLQFSLPVTVVPLFDALFLASSTATLLPSSAPHKGRVSHEILSRCRVLSAALRKLFLDAGGLCLRMGGSAIGLSFLIRFGVGKV